MMTHDEASDLLGAYALDAVDGDEFTELEAHLDTCPRCRAELDTLHEVAAAPRGEPLHPTIACAHTHQLIRQTLAEQPERPTL